MRNLKALSLTYWPYLGLTFAFALIRQFLPSKTIETDDFYHFALSKLILEKGFVSSWSALPDLGWNYQFSDKEFLFHRFTAIFYRLGNEAAVDFFCLVLALGIVLLLAKICELLAGRFGILIVALGILNYSFFFRMSMMRPHLAGIFLTLVIILGILKNKKWLLAAGALLFPLAYHALYVPLFVMGVFFIFSRERKNLLLFGFLPFFGGILINPYFPGTLQMMWLGIKIGTQSSHARNIGDEAKALPFYQAIDSIGPYIVMNIFILISLGRRIKDELLLPFMIMTLTFCGLFFISPRSIEYLLPFQLICFASAVGPLREFVPQIKRIMTLVLLLICIRYSGMFFIDQNKNARTVIRDVMTLVDKLPSESTGKVFNCEWGLGSLILNQRPGYQINEVLDPNFLFIANPEMAKIKSFLLNRPPGDLYFPIKNIFKSNYVLCLHPGITQTLKKDDRFEVIAEGLSSPTPYLFKVRGP